MVESMGKNSQMQEIGWLGTDRASQPPRVGKFGTPWRKKKRILGGQDFWSELKSFVTFTLEVGISHYVEKTAGETNLLDVDKSLT